MTVDGVGLAICATPPALYVGVLDFRQILRDSMWPLDDQPYGGSRERHLSTFPVAVTRGLRTVFADPTLQ